LHSNAMSIKDPNFDLRKSKALQIFSEF